MLLSHRSTALNEGKDARAVAIVAQLQVRCGGCNRRLADLVNEMQAGQVILEMKCPRCGHPHLEIIRPALAEPARHP